MDEFNIFKTVDEIEILIENFIVEIINTAYSDLLNDFKENIDSVIEEEKIKNSKKEIISRYMNVQDKLFEKFLNITNSHKINNLSLYAKIYEINKYFLQRKIHLKKIEEQVENNSNEKIQIIERMEKSINYYKVREISHVEEYKLEFIKLISENNTSAVFDLTSTIKESIIISTDCIYKLYEKSINSFFDSLKKYLEVNIKDLKVYKNILTDFENSFTYFSREDNFLLHKIIELLSTMKVNAVNCISLLNDLIKNNIMDKTIFKVMMTKSINTLDTKNNKDSKVEAFQISLDTLLNELLYKTLINSLKNSNDKEIEKIGQTIFFAQVLVEIFESINGYINNMIVFCDEDEKKIIEGIDETIKIKISIIKERADLFDKEVTEIIFLQNKNAILEYVGYLLVRETNFKYPKLIIEERRKFEKESDLMKKECLLHEISTFEEIVKHSIKALRSYEEDIVVDFVKFMDVVTLKIDKLLLINKIEKIYPNEKNKFNSKEHVVLLAEKNSKFAKGEIIKVISTGYKDENNIIMKASVVAAR